MDVGLIFWAVCEFIAWMNEYRPNNLFLSVEVSTDREDALCPAKELAVCFEIQNPEYSIVNLKAERSVRRKTIFGHARCLLLPTFYFYDAAKWTLFTIV